MFESDLLSQLTPEELQQLLGMGTLDERGQLLEQQMQQAQALSRPQSGGHTTGLGAALGGLGDVSRAFAGQVQGMGLQGQQQALLGQKDKGRSLYVDALRRRGALGPTAGMGDLPMMPGMG